MNQILIEKINLNSQARLEVEDFLSTFSLSLDSDVENTIVAKCQHEIVGTCSHRGNVLKCFAVKEAIQEEGVASRLMTHMTNHLFDQGIYETFIFTQPKNIPIFKGLHYREVYRGEEVALLEGGMANVINAVDGMFKRSQLGKGKRASLVMNCNPFTLGHQHLIQRAAEENEEVVVFIVEENRSVFPFGIRLDLVKKGVAHLKNVHVMAGGRYMISSNTFPSYFLREEDEKLKAYTKLDATIFSQYIAPVFNITKRYIGTEPYCPVTNQYNEALLEVLPKHEIQVIQVDRLVLGDEVVSASRVRKLLKEGHWEALKSIVPQSTYDFLRSQEAKEIIDKLKRSDTAH